MFERFTEKARRVIFFARYEASQYGCGSIETEHLLLGLVREGRDIFQRYFSPPARPEALRVEIESQMTKHERISLGRSTSFARLETRAALSGRRSAVVGP
jgi:ATP-dependent Clp protease ATP-binding subunit ClpC